MNAVNAMVDGIAGVTTSMHLCHGHFNRRRATDGGYEPIIEALAEIRVDRFAMEFAAPHSHGVGVLDRFPADKTLGLGVIDHCDPHVETPTEVVARVEKALEHIPPERLTLNPDCGFAPGSRKPEWISTRPTRSCAQCAAVRAGRFAIVTCSSSRRNPSPRARRARPYVDPRRRVARSDASRVRERLEIRVPGRAVVGHVLQRGRSQTASASRSTSAASANENAWLKVASNVPLTAPFFAVGHLVARATASPTGNWSSRSPPGAVGRTPGSAYTSPANEPATGRRIVKS